MRVKLSVGNGEHVRFWTDAWVGDLGPLANLASCSISDEERRLTICEVLTASGD